jgi:hypothetical protein
LEELIKIKDKLISTEPISTDLSMPKLVGAEEPQNMPEIFEIMIGEDKLSSTWKIQQELLAEKLRIEL